jgi:3-hydroxyisobutyrate dehydrogenase
MANREIKKIAFFGLGMMGWPMAANLAKGGFDVSVWTHSEGRLSASPRSTGHALRHPARGRRGRGRRAHHGRGRA